MNGAASVTIGSQFTVNFLDRSRWEAGCTKGAPMVPFGRCRLLAEAPVGRPRVGHGVTASSVSEMCQKAISRKHLERRRAVAADPTFGDTCPNCDEWRYRNGPSARTT